MSDEGDIRARSRAKVRAERSGDPDYVEIGGGRFALHIQYVGNAIIVDVGAGSGDAQAFREWLAYHGWSPKAGIGVVVSPREEEG